MIYCPYSDRDIPEDQSNSEHIIPLSLGGINGFEIPVSKKQNATVGSNLDGLLAKDFIIKKSRNKYDVRGHSRKKPFVEFNSAKCALTNKPLNVKFDAHEGIKIWSHLDKKLLKGQQSVALSLKVDLDVDLMFVAKVALSAGYYAYGNVFREHVEHPEFRSIMNSRPDELGPNEPPQFALVDSRFMKTDEESLQLFRLLCELVMPSSLVGFVPSSHSLSVFVGILGNYVGTITVPANSRYIPNKDEFEWGHVICLQKGELVRMSFKSILEELCKFQPNNNV